MLGCYNITHNENEMFEAVVHKRMAFVNEAFQEYNKYNNGFISGSGTSDKLPILNGLIER